MSTAAALRNEESYESTGGRLVAADGRTLPLTGASLKADARGGVVRVTLEQAFRNPYDQPLRVTYSLPLPADGAVSGFCFKLGDETIVGEVDTKRQARQRFEDAVLEGRTAALLDQERSSLFTQQVGNVPPRTEVLCQVQVDQKLAWLPDGCWEWRFPTVVAPRYLGADGRVTDHAKVTVDVADAALPVKLGLTLSIRDALAEGGRPESSSHGLHTERLVGRTQVVFADERGAGLDRDVVVRWRVAGQAPGLTMDLGELKGRLFGLVTLVPPAAEVKMPKVSRDLIVLLDTSGSMGGAPLDQARRVTSALVDSLDDADQLELIEFSSSARRWKRGAVAATAANRRDAQGWLSRLQASGGTEMRTGILEALAPLRAEAQRQVVLITDGLIGFESEIVDVIANKLPRGCRVHTIGVGSGVNRSLTQPAARAGRGLELVLGIGEDAEVAAKRLLARTSQPLVTNVEVSGTGVKATAPARLPDLYAGAPALLSLELDPRGGTVIVTGDTAMGRFVEELRVPVGEVASPAVPTLFAREAVEDLELRLASGGARHELDPQVEQLGLTFQVSTRLTSWVAVSAHATVDPRAPRRSQTMPQQLPYGMSAEGVGLRPAASLGATLAGGAPMKSMAAPAASALADATLRRGVRARFELNAPMDEEQDLSSADAGEPEPEPMQKEEAERRVMPRRVSAGAPPPPSRPAAAPPPAQSPAPAGKPGFGLFEKAKELFGGGKRDAAKDQKTAAPAAHTESRPSPRVLAARVVRSANGELTLEVVVTGAPLAWAPPAEVVVQLRDGRSVTVRVVQAKTTADGTHAPGLALSLVLATEADVTRVTIDGGTGEPLVLAIT